MTRFKIFLSLLSCALLSVKSVFASGGCAVFDSNFNLYVFGLSQDVLIGDRSTWGSPTATPLPATGRPPFDSDSPLQCYLAQFYNTAYFLNAEKDDAFAVWIYDFATKAWSKQSVTSGGVNPPDVAAILDHDTNVFYAYSDGVIYFLNMGAETTANATALSWVDATDPAFSTTGYTPTMALAQNHVFFFGTGQGAGMTSIYVIHFNFPQPAPQAFKSVNSDSTFPDTSGQATSLFNAAGVQELITFFPKDKSGTYLLDVKTNTSLKMAYPSDTSASTFFASEDAVVQLTSNNQLFYLPIDQADTTGTGANKGAAWASIKVTLPASQSSSSPTTGGGSTGGSGSPTSSGSGSTSPSGTTSGQPAGQTGGAERLGVTFTKIVVAAVVAACVLPF